MRSRMAAWARQVSALPSRSRATHHRAAAAPRPWRAPAGLEHAAACRRRSSRHGPGLPARQRLLRQRPHRPGLPQELTQRNIRMPGVVAIVGYDDIDFAAAAAPLSSVRQPRQQIGRTAAQLLVEEALGRDGHQHGQVIFQPQLEVRRSSQGRPRARRSRRPARPSAGASAIRGNSAG